MRCVVVEYFTDLADVTPFSRLGVRCCSHEEESFHFGQCTRTFFCSAVRTQHFNVLFVHVSPLLGRYIAAFHCTSLRHSTAKYSRSHLTPMTSMLLWEGLEKKLGAQLGARRSISLKALFDLHVDGIISTRMRQADEATMFPTCPCTSPPHPHPPPRSNSTINVGHHLWSSALPSEVTHLWQSGAPPTPEPPPQTPPTVKIPSAGRCGQRPEATVKSY